MIANEGRLICSEHLHTGRVLFVQGLVLNCESVDDDAFGLHALDVLNKIGGVCVVVFGAQLTPFYVVVCLHPWRGPPRRGEYLYFRIACPNLIYNSIARCTTRI